MSMNRTTSMRSEEARRQAQSASLRAKQAQSEFLKERDAALAVEAKKVDNLRAQRLAKEAETQKAAETAAAEAQEAKQVSAKETRSKRRAEARAAKRDEGGDIDGMERLG